MVRITAADLRRLGAARVAKYMEHADGTVLVEFHAPVAISPPVAPPAGKPEPEDPTPDEWLRSQYEKPDGT